MMELDCDQKMLAFCCNFLSCISENCQKLTMVCSSLEKSLDIFPQCSNKCSYLRKGAVSSVCTVLTKIQCNSRGGAPLIDNTIEKT